MSPGGSIARGASWMVCFRFLDRGLGLLSTLILARLLIPADFGLVAMAMSVIALLELATAFSLDVPLIQRADPSREHYDTAWTLNLLFASAGAIATAALAYPVAAFYGDSRLIPIMLVLACSWQLQGLENIGIVNFRRTMNFARETQFLLGRRLVAFCVTLTIALSFRSYWALVIGVVCGRLFSVALSYLMEPFRPRLSLRARGDLFSVSGWLFVNNLLHFATTRLSHFIIGRVHGAQPLGFYTIGSEFAYMPQTELVAPINRALFPGYSRMLDNFEEMRRGFLSANAVISMIVFPASIGLAVVAPLLVPIVLGPNWDGVVPIMQILCFAGGLAALTSNMYSAYLALGRPRVLTWILALEVLVLSVGLILTRDHGYIAIAYAELIAIVTGTLCAFPILFRTLKIGVRDYLSNLWRPFLAAACMGVVTRTLRDTFVSHHPGAVTELLATIATGALCYTVVLLALWTITGRPAGPESVVIDYVRSRRGKHALQT